jgi:hypothetical protein
VERVAIAARFGEAPQVLLRQAERADHYLG